MYYIHQHASFKILISDYKYAINIYMYIRYIAAGATSTGRRGILTTIPKLLQRALTCSTGRCMIEWHGGRMNVIFFDMFYAPKCINSSICSLSVFTNYIYIYVRI